MLNSRPEKSILNFHFVNMSRLPLGLVFISNMTTNMTTFSSPQPRPQKSGHQGPWSPGQSLLKSQLGKMRHQFTGAHQRMDPPPVGYLPTSTSLAPYSAPT